jgi:ribosomal protein L34
VTLQQKIIEDRKAKGLHVRYIDISGEENNYYPATDAQKADFIRRATKAGRKVLS